jgi:hypothetical protein
MGRTAFEDLTAARRVRRLRQLWGPEVQDPAIAAVMLDHDDPTGTAATVPAWLRAAADVDAHRERRPRAADHRQALHIAKLLFNVQAGHTSRFVEDLARDLGRLLRS